MKNKNIIAGIVLLLLIICLIYLIVLNVIMLNDNKTPGYGTSDQINTDILASVALPASLDAGDGYLSEIYFIGDSTTYHLKKGGIPEAHLLVPESYTLMLDSSTSETIVSSTGLSITESVKSLNVKTLIITLGVNGADRFSETQYKTYYVKLINAIKLASPNTQIILQSVFPVTEYYSNKNKGITNKGIDRLNSWLVEIAYELNLPYLDTQSVLKDSNGAMIIEFDEGDGVHMNEDGYKLIIDYIKTHPYK